MKPFLTRYDLNYNGYKGLIALVYANNYDDAIIKLKNNQTKIGDIGSEKAQVISHYNLSIKNHRTL